MLPAPEQDFQPGGPIEEPGASGTFFKVRRYLSFLLKYWWIPVTTLVIGLAAEAAYVYWKEPTFVSKASMWETLKMRLPEGEFFSEDMQNMAGTLAGFLQSETMRQAALATMGTTTNTTPIALDREGLPMKVDIRVTGSAKSAVFLIQASSADPRFTRNYLNAIMEAYLDYKKTIRKEVSGDTLASVSEQMQRWERDLKAEQDALLAFGRTNNLAILQEEATVAGSYLAKLKTELSDLQLEAHFLNANTNDQGLVPTGMVALASSMTSGSASAANPEQQSMNSLELLKAQREKLSKYLKPKHPQIVKLDSEIERAEQLQDIYRRQNREQLDAARQANQLKTDNVLASIKEWEAKVVQANATISEAERLKLNVQRIQAVYDRLALLVQNLGISRFTTEATQVINLIPADVGRPIGHLASKLAYENLVADAQEVLHTLIPKEVEVRTKDENYYLMRILPYRTVENVIDGVVITFVNITQLKQTTEELQKLTASLTNSRDYAESIIATVREPLVVLDTDLRVISANRSFYNTFQVTPEETKGKYIYELGKRQWDIPKLRQLLEEILSKSTFFQDFEVEHTFPVIGQKNILLNARKIVQDGDSPELILLAFEDITERRRAEEGGKNSRQ